MANYTFEERYTAAALRSRYTELVAKLMLCQFLSPAERYQLDADAAVFGLPSPYRPQIGAWAENELIRLESVPPSPGMEALAGLEPLDITVPGAGSRFNRSHSPAGSIVATWFPSRMTWMRSMSSPSLSMR